MANFCWEKRVPSKRERKELGQCSVVGSELCLTLWEAHCFGVESHTGYLESSQTSAEMMFSN